MIDRLNKENERLVSENQSLSDSIKSLEITNEKLRNDLNNVATNLDLDYTEYLPIEFEIERGEYEIV